MQNNQSDNQSGGQVLNESSPWPARIGKTVGGLLVTIFIFSVGVGVGDGRINIGHFGFGGSGGGGSSAPANLNYSSIDSVYDKLRENYDGKLDDTKLLDGMKKGLAEATGDPYTEYFTATEAKQFTDQVNGGGFSGIGAELGLDDDKNVIIVAPIKGMPAEKAGVKPKDIVAEIDGKSTSGLTISEAVSKIRGKKGTTVKLTLVRNNQPIEVEITRDDIQVPSVDSKMLDDGQTAYMHISTFGDNTASLARQQATDLKKQGAKAFVLDLRGNPGGEVDAAIGVASLWTPQGKLVMQAKRGSQVLETYTAQGNNILQDMPTAVLINGGSASASEIVASALRDNVGARLIGEKSYGKGVMQGIEALPGGAELKVTIARWYSPKGQNIDKKGIDPDQKVGLSDADAAAGNDPQLSAGQSYVQSKL